MMTAEQLKASILQLAMQGRLVEQRPEEGTGEELYQKIQAEKKRLTKEGKIKNQKPLPEITEDEIPFDIPENWRWVRWGDLSESIQYGFNAPAKEKGRIRMVRISDIHDNRVTWETVPYCDIAEKDIPLYLLAKNDILFARTGGTVGKSFLVKEVPEEAIYAGYLIRTRYSNHLCPEYLKFFMESPIYWGQLHEGTIATAQPNCNGKTLSKMILPIPPLAEQKRIVAKIEELMPFVEQYAAASTKLNTLNTTFPDMIKKSILQEAVQGKLVPQDPNDEPASVLLKRIAEEKKKLIKEGKIKKQKPLPEITEDEIPFDIPESWEWCRIGMVTSVKGGKRIPKGKNVSDIPTAHIYIRVTDMKNQTIIADKLKYISDDVFEEIKQYTINKDDLYLTIAGTIGVVGIVPDLFDGMNLTENAVKLCNILIDKDYLLYAIQSPLVQEQFLDRTNKVAQPKLAIIRIESTLLPLPPLTEQKRIVTRIRELMVSIDELL